MGSPPAHIRQAKDIIYKVMAGHWKISYISRSLSRWKGLLEHEETKKRIQIVDTSQYGPKRGDMVHQDYQLFVCLPSRNLYVPVESFHSIVIKEFCKEVLRLFGALRAKRVVIMVRSADEHNKKISGRVGAMNCAVEASTGKSSSVEIDMSFDQDWPAPTSRPDDPYPLDTERFFFLAETSSPRRTIVHGLDLTAARNAILEVKEDRVKNGAAIGECALKLQYSKSDDFELFAKSDQFGEARFASSQESTQTLTMEYAAQVYVWNAENGKWQ